MPETLKIPALTVVSPVYVLSPVNKNVPEPDFVKLEDPVITPP